MMPSSSLSDINEDDINKLDPALLTTLLIDRTTRKNILWGTGDYSKLGVDYDAGAEIKVGLITGRNFKVIQPRVMKAQNKKDGRTRDKAEVFTPSWVCNAQNNMVDELWFGRPDVFNRMKGTDWKATSEPVSFEKKGKRTWKRYVDAKRLEITCGEAPYLVSRYDSVSGKTIPINERIGLLDRKLRVVNENTNNREEWLFWARRAVESIYGYEFQGDNLLLARENVLYTYIEFYKDRFKDEPKVKDMQGIALVISWNLWQMDGFNYAIPYCGVSTEPRQMTIFDFMPDSDIEYFDYSSLADTKGQMLCKVRDWRSKETLLFKELLGGDKNE